MGCRSIFDWRMTRAPGPRTPRPGPTRRCRSRSLRARRAPPPPAGPSDLHVLGDVVNRSSARSTSPASDSAIASSSTAVGRNGLPRSSVRVASSASARILSAPRGNAMRAGGRATPRSTRCRPTECPRTSRVSVVSARRSASAGRPQMAVTSPSEHGDRCIAFERATSLQPIEPAFGGCDTAALVGGHRASLDQSRHAVDVAGRLRVPHSRPRAAGSPRTSRPRARGAPISGRVRRRKSCDAEKFLEEVVVSVLVPIGIERHHDWLERASDSSVTEEPLSSRTASQSCPDIRSSTAVRVRNRNSSGKRCPSTSDSR